MNEQRGCRNGEKRWLVPGRRDGNSGRQATRQLRYKAAFSWHLAVLTFPRLARSNANRPVLSERQHAQGNICNRAGFCCREHSSPNGTVLQYGSNYWKPELALGSDRAIAFTAIVYGSKPIVPEHFNVLPGDHYTSSV